MNEETVQRPDDNAPLDLGAEFSIHLRDSLSDSRTNYTIDQLSASLEMTTTLTCLVVDFVFYEPTPENNRRIVEPLCRCLSTLRCRNEHHPLRRLTLQSADLCYYGGGMWDVFEQFLIAATRYGGIFQVKILGIHYIPIQCLVEFCRNNSNLKVLEVDKVHFCDGSAQDSSAMLALDELSLENVSVEITAAFTFANFIARMTVRALLLAGIWAYAADYGDLQMTKRILSEIKIPSVKQLELDECCRIENFRAALEVGTTSLIELDVHIDYNEDDYTERLELLANFIRRAVQLNSLTILTNLFRNQQITLGRELLRAIEACATVTRIQVLDIHDVDAFSCSSCTRSRPAMKSSLVLSHARVPIPPTSCCG